MVYTKNIKLFIIIAILVSFLVLKSVSNKFITIPKYDEFPLYPKRYKNFLNSEEINLLLNECTLFEDSTIVINGKLQTNNSRTSKTCFIDKSSKINDIIKKKIKILFDLDVNIEKLQVTHYETGQYYKPHHDFFRDKTLITKNQRLKTIFVYLKSPDEGGETYFPKLDKKFSPVLGDAIAWTNCIREKNDYKFNEWSLHEGRIVTKGKKIGLNIWLLD